MNKSKTILDFFSKSPSTPRSGPKESPHCKDLKTDKETLSIEHAESRTTKSRISRQSKISSNEPASESNSKRIATFDSDSSETEQSKTKIPSKNVKRRRIIIPSDSDDSESYKPENDCNSSSSANESDNDQKKCVQKNNKKCAEKTIKSLGNFNNPKMPSGALNQTTLANSPKQNNKQSTEKTIQSLGNFNNPKMPCGALNQTIFSNSPKQKSPILSKDLYDEKKGKEVDLKEWNHEKLDWLKDKNIRDKLGKLKTDSDYNKKTLYVPESFKKTLTPAMKQWWDLKSEHFDAVLFFKVGKFYELYHMDAVVGVKELGLIFMKGDNAHSGFPEIAFGRYSESLIEKGYKVARVEQTETPQMMEERCKRISRPTKFDKVVAREICQITSKGTKTLTYQDESLGINNNFLLALYEKHTDGAEIFSEYGICFVDTSIGKFTLGQFKDDRHGSRLLTLIALYPPVEILYDKTTISKKTLQLLSHILQGVTKEAQSINSQFWDSSKVLKFIGESGYFNGEKCSLEYPTAIMDMLDLDDKLLQTPLKQHELAFKSLGACIWYLKDCCIEDCILTMRLFDHYIPVDEVQCDHTSSMGHNDFRKNMILDGVTLQNLEIVPLLPSDDSEGTLFGTMDYCCTSFGKRLFRNWLCSPLCNPDMISERLDAVDDLVKVPDTVEATIGLLKKMPDLERLLSKIHAYGYSRSQDHPDSRAVFYDADIYNKRKIHDFLSTLDGFKRALEIINEFKPHVKDFKSNLLKQCLCYDQELGAFPVLLKNIHYFDQAFDHELAKKKGNIIPSPGVDKEYDTSCEEILETTQELDSFLAKQKTVLNCKISYVASGKNRYMFEVPENKKVPGEFEFQGGRKGFKRYYTKETKKLLTHLVSAEESRDAALHDVARRIFAYFDADYDVWKTVIHFLATLDVLISLQLYYKSSAVPMCRPTFLLPKDRIEPHIEIIHGQHPTFVKYFTGSGYIPNSVYIGPKQDSKTEEINNGGKLVLVTGPNMGGKSTLMRQAGTLVIMAHLGSYIPAEAMQLTPVDRIFTRVGANDRISKGESTFFVEASELSSILHHATRNSFVLVDELGRGTSTYDGTAIAYAALDYLANDVGCRTLFSTHYYSLIEDFREHPNVGLGHMACMAESNCECPALEKITFLYKFMDGACPKSYGFNVALLAGILKDIVQHGFLKAQQLEYSTKMSKILKKLLSVKKPEEILDYLNNHFQLFNVSE